MTFFGFFQAAYLFLGWFVGGKFANFITNWDHWVAFVILTYLGGKMVIGSLKDDGGDDDKKDGKNDFLSYRRLAFLATATSIDAIAVGASLAMVQINIYRILITVFFTFVSTAAACIIGLQGGKKLGTKVGKKSEIFGGVILILIGIRIILSHILSI